MNGISKDIFQCIVERLELYDIIRLTHVCKHFTNWSKKNPYIRKKIRNLIYKKVWGVQSLEIYSMAFSDNSVSEFDLHEYCGGGGGGGGINHTLKTHHCVINLDKKYIRLDKKTKSCIIGTNADYSDSFLKYVCFLSFIKHITSVEIPLIVYANLNAIRVTGNPFNPDIDSVYIEFRVYSQPQGYQIHEIIA